jgi:integrase
MEQAGLSGAGIGGMSLERVVLDNEKELLTCSQPRPGPGEDFSFNAPRNPGNFSKEFARRAKLLGFSDFRFHHLRGTHATLLLDRNVPVHVVGERIGDDPAALLRNYAKRKRKNTADNSVSAVIGALAAGFLGVQTLWVQMGPRSHCVRRSATLSD